jgi:hypothetical protein
MAEKEDHKRPLEVEEEEERKQESEGNKRVKVAEGAFGTRVLKEENNVFDHNAW